MLVKLLREVRQETRDECAIEGLNLLGRAIKAAPEAGGDR
jgi:hypothetical protein